MKVLKFVQRLWYRNSMLNGTIGHSWPQCPGKEGSAWFQKVKTTMLCELYLNTSGEKVTTTKAFYNLNLMPQKIKL